MNVNVMTIWDDEKQIVSPMDEMENRFFVRIGAEEKQKAADTFENLEFIEAGIDGEIGFVTEKMTEKAFNDAMEGFDSFISRIRVGF